MTAREAALKLLASPPARRTRDRWDAGRMERWHATARVRGLLTQTRLTSCGYDLQVGRAFRLARCPGAVVELGNGVWLLDDVGLSLDAPGARISIGDHTFVNGGSRIHSRTSVSIGARCALSWGVRIIDSDYHQVGGARVDAPVQLGDEVWVGAGAQILKGVTVGDGAVIAAGAVVTRDVPAHGLVGGNPARLLRSEISWSP